MDLSLSFPLSSFAGSIADVANGEGGGGGGLARIFGGRGGTGGTSPDESMKTGDEAESRGDLSASDLLSLPFTTVLLDGRVADIEGARRMVFMICLPKLVVVIGARTGRGVKSEV